MRLGPFPADADCFIAWRVLDRELAAERAVQRLAEPAGKMYVRRDDPKTGVFVVDASDAVQRVFLGLYPGFRFDDFVDRGAVVSCERAGHAQLARAVAVADAQAGRAERRFRRRGCVGVPRPAAASIDSAAFGTGRPIREVLEEAVRVFACFRHDGVSPVGGNRLVDWLILPSGNRHRRILEMDLRAHGCFPLTPLSVDDCPRAWSLGPQ